MKTPPKDACKGVAYHTVLSLYNASPGSPHKCSWRMLNPSLSSVLRSCIRAQLPFLPGEIEAIYRDTCGGYWFGDGGGSHTGEGFYNIAVDSGNTSAAISFETWAGRPAVLWESDTATPARLAVGSEFVWKGVQWTVTSLRKDSLVACHYGPYQHDRHSRRDELRAGDSIGYGDAGRLVLSCKKLGKHQRQLVVGPLPAGFGERKIVKRITITYAEISEFRAEMAKRARAALKLIEKAETVDAVTEARDTIAKHGTGYYRHFDVEKIRSAITAKLDTLGAKEGELKQLERWRAGEYVGRWFETVALRVRGNHIETSTGQSASVEAVKRVLPVILANRNAASARPTSLNIDGHEVREITRRGVQVGCTLVPWGEVLAISKILQKTA